MPHISEGDLHAWLDGAIPEGSDEHRALRLHLESCADCTSRLEEARELRAETAGILDAAVPRGPRPGFEHIQQRAGGDEPGVKTPAAVTRGLRSGWLSPQRLGWAATVMLALGAGWIGRAVLEEKGWTDPFHEAQVPALESIGEVSSAETETARKDDVEFFADNGAADEESAAAEGQRRQRMARDNEAPAVPDAPMAETVLPSELKAEGEALREGAPADAPGGRDQDAATPGRTGALAQADALEAEDRVEVDEVAERSGEPTGLESRAKSVRPGLDSWHAPPEKRLAPAPEAVIGCYRLEFSWSPGLGYLPGRIDLTSGEPTGWAEQAIYSIDIPEGATSRMYEAIWTSPAEDSIWVRLVPGEDREALTVRAERVGTDWEGEGRVLDPAAPVSAGQTRGTVLLVRVDCEAP